MRNKYVIPDLAVVLLCDSRTSLANQQRRAARIAEFISEEEVNQFDTFKSKNFLPNALYLDQSRALTENFYSIALAFKERCEDKRRDTVAGKITAQSINYFIQQNEATFLKSQT